MQQKTNNKRSGFLGVAVIAFATALVAFGAIGYTLKAQKQSAFRLGASTGSGVFPTSSLNNFQDGDIINSADWNAIERKIGINNSTDTASLDYKVSQRLTTSTGLTTANFATTSISQWNNNSGYITTSTGLTTSNFATTSISQWNNNSGYISTTTLSVTSSVKLGTDSAGRIRNATTSRLVTILSPSSTDDFAILRMSDSATLSAIQCTNLNVPGNTVTFQLNFGSTMASTSKVFSAYQTCNATSGTPTTYTSFASSSFVAGDWIRFTATTTAANVSSTGVTLNFDFL